MATVTDLACVGDALLVAGLSNEEFASKLRRIPLPVRRATSTRHNLEIFHVSHGQWETAAPIRTFVPYEEGRSILASYTCTPVVHFSLDDVEPNTKIVGRTVAELGAMNQPLDMVSCTIGGEEHRARGQQLARIDQDRDPRHRRSACADRAEGARRRAPRGRGPAGHRQARANLNGNYVLALQVDDAGGKHLRSLKTASL